MAAGSLLITEAGGLIGNFTGEADLLYQREAVAGNPKIHGQLVRLPAPYARVIRDEVPAPVHEAAPADAESAMEPQELVKRRAIRLKKPAGTGGASG